ncbi:MAG: class I SAM-dependent methyltransferase [Pyrinomonadaceae bacterium]
MIDSIARFSNRVENYIKYRPGYPSAVIDYLTVAGVLTNDSIVADIGCGTGISSRIFLENGNAVIGVEPNDSMRTAAIRFLTGFPKFTPIDGTSEATTLSDASVDMVVAAQAFHWFDPTNTKKEFQRIVRSGGHIVIIWNERQLYSTPFLVDYEAFLLKYATDYAAVRHDKIDEASVKSFTDTEVDRVTFENVQELDFDGLKGRMLSSSYMPSVTDNIYTVMVAELLTLFAKHAENGRIKVFYDTNVFSSRT